MGEISLVSRLEDEVSFMLTDLLEKGLNPTTQQLMQITFQSQYNSDSRKQRDTIYGIIIRRRDAAILDFEYYAASPEFTKDMASIDYYNHPEEITDEYAEYDARLYEGFFGTETKTLKQFNEELKSVAILWDKKIKEFSEQGNNLVVATGGPKSRWKIPSYWGWAIRERDLYVISAKIIVKQLKRGIGTKALPNTTQTRGALTLTTEVQKALEYKSKIPQ